MKRADRVGYWLAVGVAALGLVASGCGRQTRGPEPFPVVPSVLEANGMDMLWHTQLVLAKKTHVVRLWLCNSLLIGLGDDNRIYAVDAKTGVRRWSVPTAPVHETVWQPAVYGDKVWVASTTTLFGLEAATGRETSRRRLDFAVSGRPAACETHVFIPNVAGYLEALAVVPDTVPWRRWMEGTVTAGPALDNTMVYFASQGGQVIASNQVRHRTAWLHRTEGAVTADLRCAKGGLALVASLDYSVYAFAGSSGRLAWQYHAGEPVRMAPYTQGDLVFVFTASKGLTAVDVESGDARWTLAAGRDYAAADTKNAYIVSRGDDILAVSRTDGTVRFGLPLRRGTLVGENETDSGVLYLATPEGQVMAAAAKSESP
jgi:outer membrane protein assembly factor BamB